MPEYYCRKIQSLVEAEKSGDLTGRIFNSCGYYTLSTFGQNRYPCIKDSPKFKRCDVVRQIEKEIRR
jgi:hypothetical protein